jgi:hypothetical protein
MSNQTSDLTQGPFRITRTRDGKTMYYAGHHENGQIHWVEEEDKGVHYPTAEMAVTTKNPLKFEPGDTLNVVRINS